MAPPNLRRTPLRPPPEQRRPFQRVSRRAPPRQARQLGAHFGHSITTREGVGTHRQTRGVRVYSESVQRASGKAKERKELICNVDVCIFKKDAPFEMKIPPKLSRKIFVINFNHSETTLKQGTSLVHKASERERARLVTTESGRGSFSTSRAWFVSITTTYFILSPREKREKFPSPIGSTHLPKRR